MDRHALRDHRQLLLTGSTRGRTCRCSLPQRRGSPCHFFRTSKRVIQSKLGNSRLPDARGGKRQSSSVALAVGDGGGRPPIPPRWRVNEDEPIWGEGPFSEAEGILAKSGVEQSTLPADIQEGLNRGIVTAADMKNYLAIAGTPVLGWICKLLPSFRERVMGNPRFLLVLAIEEIIGCTAKMAAEVQGRGDDFWKELHFVASDIALELIGNFAVVCLLSPKRSFKQRPTSGLGQAIAGLPGHAFQIGNFSLPQRLSTILYRGAQFFTVGFLSSVVGHSLTKYGVEKQQNAHPKLKGETPYKPLAPVLDNSATWGGFMALSTNLRYQLVNGIEERVLDSLIQSTGVKGVITFLLRFGNTFAGGAQWVWYARVMGLQ